MVAKGPMFLIKVKGKQRVHNDQGIEGLMLAFVVVNWVTMAVSVR